jgi:unsaturated chondroitin disaccharide hydrolase
MSTVRSLDEALGLVRQRVRSTLTQVSRDGIFPHAAPCDTGVWAGTREGQWTSGFWAGWLWHEAALSGRREDRETAEAWTVRLAPHLERKTHDIGFVFASSAILGWEIGKSAACRELGLAAAGRLAGMFNPVAEVIPVGPQGEIGAGLDDVTIDCMVNLPLLWWAWAETGEERFRHVAASHADRTAAWHVKPDGRIIQSVHFDPDTGQRTLEETHQGWGKEGCWTRGQAWGIYGYAVAYRTTGDARYLELADRTATYYFQRAGADLVPFYCFDDPARPNVPRDASAAAITSAGLWILAEHATDAAVRQRSRARAHGLLSALVAGFLTPEFPGDARPPGMLLHSCYNRKAGWDTDHEIVWATYFLLEALRASRGAGD